MMEVLKSFAVCGSNEFELSLRVGESVARWITQEVDKRCSALSADLARLGEELAQAKLDRDILAAEVRAWRGIQPFLREAKFGVQCLQHHVADALQIGQLCPVCTAWKVTDASGALDRAAKGGA